MCRDCYQIYCIVAHLPQHPPSLPHPVACTHPTEPLQRHTETRPPRTAALARLHSGGMRRRARAVSRRPSHCARAAAAPPGRVSARPARRATAREGPRTRAAHASHAHLLSVLPRPPDSRAVAAARSPGPAAAHRPATPARPSLSRPALCSRAGPRPHARTPPRAGSLSRTATCAS